jgi:phage gp46-like protein
MALKPAGLRPFVDLAFVRTSDGQYDIDVDTPNRDAKTTNGLQTALLVSLFTDRRARPDEVADPMRRRGWIGDLVSTVPGDIIGSGLWLYEQSRMTPGVIAGVAAEARNALQWMIDDGLCNSIGVDVVPTPGTRTLSINITIGLSQGGVTRHSFVLASNTLPTTLS